MIYKWFFFFKFYFIFKLYNIVLVLPNIKMNPPQVYPCYPSWTLLPPPSPYPPSGSSQCTSPKHPVSCIEPGLATRFIHDILLVSMPFSQIFPPSPSPTDQSYGLCIFFLMSECQKLEQTSRKARYCPSQFPTQAGFLSHLKEMQSFLLCASESPRNKGYSRHSTAWVPTVGLSASC